MPTYTSTLPKDLLDQLGVAAKALDSPKNRIIEKALITYLKKLKQAQYAKAYANTSEDEEYVSMAEEGMIEYKRILEEYEK